MRDTLGKLRAANVERQGEWNDDGMGVLFKALELAGEVGEFCNVIKKIERERLGVIGSRASLQDAKEELADVIICADLVAQKLGFTLDEIVAMKFNLTSAKNGLKTRMEEV